MFASVLPRKADPAVPFAGLSNTQCVLLAQAGKPELEHMTACLGEDYRLFPVSTEQQLIDTLERQPVQLIIIYAGSGKTQGGVQLCAAVKSNSRFGHLPVIGVIGTGDVRARISCLESGSDACMEFPFSGEHLRAQIKNLLANRRRLEHYHSRCAVIGREGITGAGEDEGFLHRLSVLLSENLQDTGLDVDVLARLMHVSRPTLYRKIRSVSKHTPNELITAFRLYKAAELLASGDTRVSSIVKQVGFHSRSNFGKAFIKQFGVTPRQYRQAVKH